MIHETASRPSNRVIVVDHDVATTELIAELLTSEGCTPLCCAGWVLSVDFIEQMQANLLILELGLGDPSVTLNLLDALRCNCRTRSLPVIVNSTDDRLIERLAAPLHDLGCLLLAKPFELDDFFASIRACLNTGSSQTQGAPAE
jgi:DNA-binding response OmpR family regulator